ncbi:MAG: NUDIX hydrolase [Candidatus Magasanikbacteria bacterium]|nr:NUDIX hydrolase [Candidatus Magasanikbacteria bacterium]
MKKLKLGPLTTIYHGKIFTIKQRPVTFPNGSQTMFEYCARPGSVSILAFNEKNELLMIKERRHEYKKSVWFLPGGRIDNKNDTPKKAALRELREETGYSAKTIKLIHKKSPSDTLLWNIYIFAAKNLFSSPLPPDPGELITPHFIPFKKAVKMALDGTIENEFIAYNIIRFNEMLRNKEFRW